MTPRLFLLAVLSACAYDARFEDCVVHCAVDMGCPDDLKCGADNLCRLPDAVGACEQVASICMNVGDPIVDLARDRPAQADKTSALHGAEKANDNDDSTSWNAGDAEPGHWWSVDLGNHRLLTSLNTLWEYDSIQHYQYEVSVSSDGINFTTVIDQTADTRVSKLRTDTFPNDTCARYVRLTKTDNTGYWAILFTVNVLGR